MVEEHKKKYSHFVMAHEQHTDKKQTFRSVTKLNNQEQYSSVFL